MKILFLLPAVPDPPDAGAKLRNLGLLRLAAAEHAVDVLAFSRPPAFSRRSRPRRLGDALRSDLPDMALRLWSPGFAAEVRRRLASQTYDLVQAEGIEMARYLAEADVPPAQRVYDAHNPEALLQRRAWAAAVRRRAPLAAAYSLVQWRRLARFERAVIRSAGRTLAVSYHDANQLEALAGRPVHVVPSGVDLERFAYAEPGENQRDLLFLGKLDYRPNAEAVQWLIEHVLPRLPLVRLFAVGANPPRWLVAAGQHDARIAVTGAVADERPYLRRAALLLLPLEVAAGSRLKALVALASGLPIVSTPVGMEGLDAAPGEHYACVPDLDPAAWATALADLLSDAGRRRQLALAGRALVERCYAWEAIAPALAAAYADAP